MNVRVLRCWRRSLFAILVFALGGTSLAVAQGGVEVPASLDQLATSSGRRPLTAPASALSMVPEDFANARIAPGFLLQMEVYNAPEMNANLRVNEHGDLTIPLLGPVHVGGETVSEAQTTVAQAMVSGELLKTPQVTLNVLEYTSGSLTVLGEVQSPGRIPMLAPKNLAEVLALAGGETLTSGNEIEVRHNAANAAGTEKLQVVHYAQGSSPDALRAVMVYPGDSVFVKRAGIVYVLGAVHRPGGYLMVNSGSLNVLQAVALAEGMTNVSAHGSVRVLRPIGDGRYMSLDVHYVKVSRGETPPLALQAQDILYVPTSTTKSVLIDSSGIVGTAASAAIYRF